MTGKPVDRQSSIQRIEASIALVEGALQDCYFAPDGSLRAQTRHSQQRADTLFGKIKDMKIALYHVKNGVQCPNCMATGALGSNFCSGCGLKFET